MVPGVSDTGLLAGRYEVLRASQMGGAAPPVELGLLLAGGLPGWMQSVWALPLPAGCPAGGAGTAGTAAAAPVGAAHPLSALQVEAARCLASVVLANHAQEVST